MDNHNCPISLLIPTMNRPESLKRTLNTYMSGLALPSQVIVVDQSQTEEMQKQNREVLDYYNDRTECKYVYQQKPSLTLARNNAFQYAKEEIIVYSDDDVDAYPQTLNNVFEVMKDASVSMIAGIDDNGNSNNSPLGFIVGTRSFKNRNIGHVTKSMLGRFPNSIQGEVNTQWAMGYFFVIRRSLVISWGLKFDENLESYALSEDLDFSYSYYKHSKKESYRCIISDKVHVKHLVSREYRVPSKKETYMFVLYRAYLSKKHGEGLYGRICCGWCDFWRLILRVKNHETPKDMYNAMLYLIKNRNDVNNGHFYYGGNS